MLHKGACHCGKIAYEVDAEFDQAIECNCSHCSRKGYLLAFVPGESLSLLTDAAYCATYTFNKHQLQHHFCRTCGCAPYSEGRDPSGKAMAAVNLRCVEGVDLGKLKIVPVDGRSF